MTGLTALSELKSLTNGNPAIKIAVLDGPVDLNHPCFKSSIVNPSSPGSPKRARPQLLLTWHWRMAQQYTA